jgi:hypothetical protein
MAPTVSLSVCMITSLMHPPRTATAIASAP